MRAGERNRLRQQGADDAAARRPIDSFYRITGILHSESQRAEYEIGYRAEKAQRDKGGVPILHYATGYMPPELCRVIYEQKKREFEA